MKLFKVFRAHGEAGSFGLVLDAVLSHPAWARRMYLEPVGVCEWDEALDTVDAIDAEDRATSRLVPVGGFTA